MQGRISPKLAFLLLSPLIFLVLCVGVGWTVSLAHGFSRDYLTPAQGFEFAGWDVSCQVFADGKYLILPSKQLGDFKVRETAVARVFDVSAGQTEWAEVRYLWFGKRGLDQVILHLWQSKHSMPILLLPTEPVSSPVP